MRKQNENSKISERETRERQTISGMDEKDSLAVFSAEATFQRCLLSAHCLFLNTYKACSPTG